MTLLTPAFLGVLVLTISVCRFSSSTRVKQWVLLFASWVFYATWDWRALGLLVAITAVAFSSAAAMRTATAVCRKRWMVAAVSVLVGLLGVFKYLGFLTESLGGLLQRGGTSMPALSLLAPIGISFITFQSIAYVVDVYRRRLDPASFEEVGILVAFFPHVIAGPLLRPGDFITQLRRGMVPGWAGLDAGTQQFVAGLALKVLVADRLGAFVDPVFARTEIYSSTTLWVATFAYSVQIYADFAGYSAMAIGAAKMLDLFVPPNFSAPYGSLSVTEFWRRWHISLSCWLREYLYIPLGGNRRGRVRQAVNLMVVMLLAGLWHGAAWTFVVWGGLHGAALVVHKVWSDRHILRPAVPAALGAVMAWAGTWVFVSLAWVFFRSADLPAALEMLRRMWGLGESAGVEWIATTAVLLVPAVLVASVAYARGLVGVAPVRLGTFRGAFVATALLIALVLFWPTVSSPFIYLQF